MRPHQWQHIIVSCSSEKLNTAGLDSMTPEDDLPVPQGFIVSESVQGAWHVVSVSAPPLRMQFPRCQIVWRRLLRRADNV